MIQTKSRFKVLKLYAEKVPLKDKLGLSFYSAYEGKDTTFMMKKIKKTIVIDLTLSEEELLMALKSNTRNEVRKGIKEGFIVEEVKDIESFVEYYNNFAAEKNLETISANDITKYPKVLLNKCTLNGNILTMHANIVDEKKKIVRLLYSASIRFDAGVDRKNVGISNRLLHYKELLLFKEAGYTLYDFGGINEDPNDKEQYNISQFKKGFGGEVKEVVFLTSYIANIILSIKKMFSNEH